MSRGLVSPDALEDALDYQESVNLPLGALALSKGLLSEKQLLHVHAAQWNSDKKFGEIAVRKGFMTRAQLDELLREQKEGRVFLGQALVEQGALDSSVLESSLQSYKDSQKIAEQQIRQDLRALDDFLLVSPAVQLTTRLMLRMGGMVAKVAAVSEDTRLQPFDHVFWQEVGGERPFTYGLSVHTPDLLDLTESMLYSMGEDTEAPDEVNMVVLDVGKEFVNIVVGHVCTWLSREGLNGMPLPPDAAEGNTELPTGWDGASRRVNIRLLMTRGEMALSVLTPATPPAPAAT